MAIIFNDNIITTVIIVQSRIWELLLILKLKFNSHTNRVAAKANHFLRLALINKSFQYLCAKMFINSILEYGNIAGVSTARPQCDVCQSEMFSVYLSKSCQYCMVFTRTKF